jgi:mono/diheme cytochrome c family protein
MRQGRMGTAAAAAEPVWHALTTEELRKAIDYATSFAPRGARGNPAAGRLLYATYCVHCHGQRGAGDGRLAATLARRPLDLRTVDAVGRADQLVESIRGGGSPEHARYMPDWGRVFSDQQLWDLIAYLPALRAGR